MTGGDDLERQLRAAFDARADDAPQVDLAGGALREAGRIKRRRNLTAVAVAAAVVAIAVPVAANVASQPGDPRPPIASSPTQASEDTETPAVNVRIVNLPLGNPPSVPYVHDRIYTNDGVTEMLDSPADAITDVVPLDQGPAIFGADRMTGKITVSSNGVSNLLPQGTSASNPAYDSATGESAWAEHDAPGGGGDEMIVVTKSFNAPVALAATNKLDVQTVMGLHDRVVVLNGRRNGQSMPATYDVAHNNLELAPWGDATAVTAVDPEFTRVAVVESRASGGSPRCTSMLDFDDASEQWSSCEWRPVEFSPDGSRVLAVASNTDGLAPRNLAVMDAASGTVVGRFTTPGGFGRATFEDADTIVAVLVDDGQAAIVRCRVGGSCELAIPAANVGPFAPESLVDPYQLTAN